MTINDYPLKGIRVLDFSRVVAGPFATRMLSDLGADVVKVEPPEGDVTRHIGKAYGGATGFYLQQNIGKRNVSLDLKADGARELALSLVEKADIVVENFRPGIMKRFGLAWDELKQVNPKLVMLSISGFGQSGPEKNRAAYAPVVHAEAGILARQAQVSSGQPADIQMSLADTFSGLHGLVGILAALRVAERTGVGQHIDISMIDVIHATDDFAHWAIDDVWPRPEENLVWEAPEGQRILVSSDLKWIWHVLSRNGLVADPSVSDSGLAAKIARRRETIASYLTSFETFEMLTVKLDELNLVWGKVRAFGEESFAQPSVAARGVFVNVKDDVGHPRQTVQSPYKFSESKSGISDASITAGRGQDNIAVLQDWLGCEVEQVERLVEQGLLVSE